eukprot:1156039-Pelagomonas_calceolata.AAC.1
MVLTITSSPLTNTKPEMSCKERIESPANRTSRLAIKQIKMINCRDCQEHETSLIQELDQDLTR